MNVPISSTWVAWAANTSISRKRPSSRPTIIPDNWAKPSRVEASTVCRYSGGGVVCASAYSSTSGSIIGAMATMVGALPRTGATGPGLPVPARRYPQTCAPSRSSPPMS